jgi:hypothetical protein
LLVALTCAVIVVAFAMRGVPRSLGLVRAVIGLVTLGVAGYTWLLLMSTVVRRLRPGVYVEIIVALSFYVAPTLIALVVVRLVGRDSRARMAG